MHPKNAIMSRLVHKMLTMLMTTRTDRHTIRECNRKTNLNADWRPEYDPKAKLIFQLRIQYNVLLLSVHRHRSNLYYTYFCKILLYYGKMGKYSVVAMYPVHML